MNARKHAPRRANGPAIIVVVVAFATLIAISWLFGDMVAAVWTESNAAHFQQDSDA